MTTPEGVISDDPIANEETALRKHCRIVRIRTTAMEAVPQRTPFAGLPKASPGNEDA
jgi:hypothetical protein